MEGRIEKIKENIYAVIGKPVEVGWDEPIKNCGITSMNMLVLISHLEDTFDIEIPDNELILENFESINRINWLIEKLEE